MHTHAVELNGKKNFENEIIIDCLNTHTEALNRIIRIPCVYIFALRWMKEKRWECGFLVSDASLPKRFRFLSKSDSMEFQSQNTKSQSVSSKEKNHRGNFFLQRSKCVYILCQLLLASQIWLSHFTLFSVLYLFRISTFRSTQFIFVFSPSREWIAWIWQF